MATTVDFIQGATLSYFIPLATDFQLQEALATSELSLQESIQAIEPREALFFGGLIAHCPGCLSLTCLFIDPQMKPSRSIFP